MDSWTSRIPRLRYYSRIIERRLRSFPDYEQFPKVFSQAAQEMLGAGGKLIRPTLTLCASEINGERYTTTALEAAVGLEMMHVGSLILDDIIDKSAMRRGVPCIHKKYGYDVAMISAGMMLHHALRNMIDKPSSLALATRYAQRKRMRSLASKMLFDLMLGQALETRGRIKTREQYLRMIELKTATLFKAAMMLGAAAADLGANATTALGEYGKSFGMAFQLSDDILDMTGSVSAVRKTLRADLKNGRPSFVAVALGIDSTSGHRRQIPRPMAEKALTDGMKLASKFAHEAVAALADFPPTPSKRCLVALAEKVVDRDF